jgi:uncharacterized protein (TIGR03066 family)
MMSVVLVAVVIVGCGGSKPKDQIVGKWEATESVLGKDVKVVMEFTADGAAKMSMNAEGQEIPGPSGKYKFIDDNTMEIEYTEDGKTKKDKATIESISSEKVVMVGEGGKKKELKKVK